MAAYRFRPSLAGTLATVVVALVCLQLGSWQLSRADARQERLDRQERLGEESGRSLAEVLGEEAPDFHRLRVRGEFDNERSILLDNRIVDSMAGYHVLTPLETEDGTVLVNRGWIPRGRDRAQLPEIPDIEGEVEVRGHARTYDPRTMVLAEDDLEEASWPLRVQRVDMEELSGVLGVELAPFEIRVDPDLSLEADEQFTRRWRDVSMTPQRHRAYAVQWFGIGTVAVVIFVAASFRSTASRSDNREA